MKKLLALILASSLVLTSSACSNKATQPNPQQSDEKLQSNQPTPTPAPVHESENCVDAISYEMELFLDTKEKTLTEKVFIEVENKTSNPVSELCIRDMTPEILRYCEEYYSEDNKKLKTDISSITLKDGNEPLEYNFGEIKSVILVSLGEDNAIAPGQKETIAIDMTTDIPNRNDRFGFRKTKKGTLFALSFCYPYLADNKNGEWNTDPYFDDGENRSTDLADYSVKLHVPETYTVAMSGIEAIENGTVTSKIEAVRDFAIVACDFMKKETFEADGITVNSYYLKGKNSDIYRETTKVVAEDSIRMFNEKIGPYPYDELDIAPCLLGFGYGGMEYPAFIMVNASGFFDGPFYDLLSHEAKVSHEIAHQWFYSIVGNNEYREAWIDEGLATILEQDIYGLTSCDAHDYISKNEKDYPNLKEKEELRDALISSARDSYKGYFLNIPPNEFTGDRYYGDAEYTGSYCFFQEVRQLIGDDNFSDMLKKLYETFYMKAVTTEDILKLIRTYDNSEKMNEIISFYFK